MLRGRTTMNLLYENLLLPASSFVFFYFLKNSVEATEIFKVYSLKIFLPIILGNPYVRCVRSSSGFINLGVLNVLMLLSFTFGTYHFLEVSLLLVLLVLMDEAVVLLHVKNRIWSKNHKLYHVLLLLRSIDIVALVICDLYLVGVMLSSRVLFILLFGSMDNLSIGKTNLKFNWDSMLYLIMLPIFNVMRFANFNSVSHHYSDAISSLIYQQIVRAYEYFMNKINWGRRVWLILMICAFSIAVLLCMLDHIYAGGTVLLICSIRPYYYIIKSKVKKLVLAIIPASLIFGFAIIGALNLELARLFFILLIVLICLLMHIYDLKEKEEINR